MTVTATTERPCKFSDAEVREILAGRVTRLIRCSDLKLVTGVVIPEGAYFDAYHGGPSWCWWMPDNRLVNSLPFVKCPYGKPGDRLWVREAWAVGLSASDGDAKFYRATDDVATTKYMGRPARGHWRQAAHMPRYFSRINLEVVSVRCERVQPAEGFQADPELIRRYPIWAWNVEFRRTAKETAS